MRNQGVNRCFMFPDRHLSAADTCRYLGLALLKYRRRRARFGLSADEISSADTLFVAPSWPIGA